MPPRRYSHRLTPSSAVSSSLPQSELSWPPYFIAWCTNSIWRTARLLQGRLRSRQNGRRNPLLRAAGRFMRREAKRAGAGCDESTRSLALQTLRTSRWGDLLLFEEPLLQLPHGLLRLVYFMDESIKLGCLN